MHPTIAYKVLTNAQMETLMAGEFKGAPIDLADGYIHLSTAKQLTETVDKYFADQDGIWVAAVNLTPLGQAIRWEESRGGALFPHLYGDLTMDMVTAHAPLSRDTDGQVQLPDAT